MDREGRSLTEKRLSNRTGQSKPAGNLLLPAASQSAHDHVLRKLRKNDLAGVDVQGRSQAIQCVQPGPVPKDPVQAYTWANLSAANAPPGKERDEAVEFRDGLREKLIPEQIAEAQKVAREWEQKPAAGN